jgi:hypothetical protein
VVERPESHSIEYWRARAEALEHEVGLLRELVWALVDGLPAGRIAGIIEAVRSSALVLPAGEVPSPAPSDVRTELRRIWDTLLPLWRE